MDNKVAVIYKGNSIFSETLNYKSKPKCEITTNAKIKFGIQNNVIGIHLVDEGKEHFISGLKFQIGNSIVAKLPNGQIIVEKKIKNDISAFILEDGFVDVNIFL